MHIVATNSQLVLMLAAMGFSAAALHGWLRGYAIASLVLSVVAGIVAFMAAPYEPNIVLGIGERISIGAFLLWVIVLALALWLRRWTPQITRRRFRQQRRWPEHVNGLPEAKHKTSRLEQVDRCHARPSFVGVFPHHLSGDLELLASDLWAHR